MTPPSGRSRRIDARIPAATFAVVWAGGFLTEAMLAQPGPDAVGVIAISLPAVAVGLLLATKRRDLWIGPLLVLMAAAPATLSGLEAWGLTAVTESSPPGAAAATLLYAGGWPALFVGPVLIALTYPDGRLPSPRWRPVVAATLATPLINGLGTALDPATYGTAPGLVPLAPPAAPAWLVTLLYGLGIVGLVGTSALGLVALVLRFRAGTATIRLQIRWLALGAALFPVSLLTGWAVVLLVDPDLGSALALTGLAAGAITMPVAIAVAVLRHGLWSLDRLVSRTLAYALVTATMVATYAVVVTSLARLLPVSSSLAVAAATLAAAAVFRPALKRVRDVVDRRFNRERYDAQQVVEAFGTRLRGPVEVDAVVADLVGVVRRTVEPGMVGVWVRR